MGNTMRREKVIWKIDLVMWTKNGAETLPFVLKRISEVIPNEFVNNRIIVDDNSTDDTREFARIFRWKVVLNNGAGVSDGANTALKLVESEFFISFEQDLVLARNWWERIPKLLLDENVAVASGMRVSNIDTIRKIEEYSVESYKRKGTFASYDFGRTLDNTIYKTSVIRLLGGFPKMSASAGVDTTLAANLRKNDYQWKVAYDVKSTHLRKGLMDEIYRRYWYVSFTQTIDRKLGIKSVSLKRYVIHLVFSPLRSLDIAFKKRCPQAVVVYPLMRLAMLRGRLTSK
jgi:glycosyltransferase involved in cell wall biosynthesis